MSDGERSRDTPEEKDESQTNSPASLDSEQGPSDAFDHLLSMSPHNNIDYDVAPRSASHSPSSRDPATGSLDQASVDFPPVTRLLPPTQNQESSPEERPSNRRRSAAVVPHNPRDVIVYSQKSPTKFLQLDHRVFRRSLARSSENSWATRAVKEYAKDVRELRGWVVSRSGQWMACRRRTTSDISDNIVRYGPYLATSRFLAMRRGPQASPSESAQDSVSSPTFPLRPIVRHGAAPPRIAYTMDDVILERRRLRSLGHDPRHGKVIKALYESSDNVASEFDSSTYTEEEEADDGEPACNTTHATVRMVVSIGRSLRRFRKWITRRSRSVSTELPPPIDLTDAIIQRSISQVSVVRARRLVEGTRPLLPPRSPQRLERLQMSALEGVPGLSVQSDEPVSPKTVLGTEDPIYSSVDSNEPANDQANTESTRVGPQTGSDENVRPPNFSRPLELRPRLGIGPTDVDQPVPNEDQQAPTSQSQLVGEIQSTTNESAPDSRNASSSEPPRNYVGKGKGRARDSGGGPQIFSAMHIPHLGQRISFMETVDDDIVRAVMAESLKEWQENQRQKRQQTAPNADLRSPERPPVPVVKSVFECWREGIDPFLDTQPEKHVLSRPRSSHIKKVVPCTDEPPTAGTLRRCWDALKDTVDAFGAVWDGDQNGEPRDLAGADARTTSPSNTRPKAAPVLTERTDGKQRRLDPASTPQKSQSAILGTTPSRPQRPTTMPRSSHFNSLNASPITSQSSKRRRKPKTKRSPPTPARTPRGFDVDHTYSTDDEPDSNTMLDKILYTGPPISLDDQLCVFTCPGEAAQPDIDEAQIQARPVDADGCVQGQANEPKVGPSGMARSKGKERVPASSPKYSSISDPQATLVNLRRSRSAPAAMLPVKTYMEHQGPSTGEGHPTNDISLGSDSRADGVEASGERQSKLHERTRYLTRRHRKASKGSVSNREPPDLTSPEFMAALKAIETEQRENEHRATMPYKLRFTAGRQRHEHTRYFPRNPFPHSRNTPSSSPEEDRSGHGVMEPEPVIRGRAPHLTSTAGPDSLADKPNEEDVQRPRGIPAWLDQVEAMASTSVVEVNGVVQDIARMSLENPTSQDGEGVPRQGAANHRSPRSKRLRDCSDPCFIMSAATSSRDDTLNHLCLPFRLCRGSELDSQSFESSPSQSSGDTIMSTFGVNYEADVMGLVDRRMTPPACATDSILCKMANVDVGESTKPPSTIVACRKNRKAETSPNSESHVQAQTKTLEDQSIQRTKQRVSTADNVLCSMADISPISEVPNNSRSRGRESCGNIVFGKSKSTDIGGTDWCSMDYTRKMLTWTPCLIKRRTVSWETFVELAGLPPMLSSGPIAPLSDLTNLFGLLYDLYCVHHGVSFDQDILEARCTLHRSLLDLRLQSLCKCA